MRGDPCSWLARPTLFLRNPVARLFRCFSPPFCPRCKLSVSASTAHAKSAVVDAVPSAKFYCSKVRVYLPHLKECMGVECMGVVLIVRAVYCCLRCVQVVHGRKYGLVGPNGAGKSTLLKMIASGELKIPPRYICGCVTYGCVDKFA